MDEHAAMKIIFEAHKVVVEKLAVCESAHEDFKAAKEALYPAQTILNERIQEARTGQEMLPFEGANGKALGLVHAIRCLVDWRQGDGHRLTPAAVALLGDLVREACEFAHAAKPAAPPPLVRTGPGGDYVKDWPEKSSEL